MTKLEATSKVMSCRGFKFTDEEICKQIGISKPTFYTRIREHNWKKGEIILIESL